MYFRKIFKFIVFLLFFIYLILSIVIHFIEKVEQKENIIDTSIEIIDYLNILKNIRQNLNANPINGIQILEPYYECSYGYKQQVLMSFKSINFCYCPVTNSITKGNCSPSEFFCNAETYEINDIFLWKKRKICLRYIKNWKLINPKNSTCEENFKLCPGLKNKLIKFIFEFFFV